MKVIGLTGSIATGKSSVAQLLKQAGFPIVDADRVAREVVEPGTTTLEKIKLVFGSNVINNGVLDRQLLGRMVFESPNRLEQLDTIIQPVILSALEDKIAFWRLQKVPVLIVDIPLLFEHDYDKNGMLDQIIVVTATVKEQLERLIARDHLSELQAQQRINSQLPVAQKAEHADYVIDNSDQTENLAAQVVRLVEDLKE